MITFDNYCWGHTHLKINGVDSSSGRMSRLEVGMEEIEIWLVNVNC